MSAAANAIESRDVGLIFNKDAGIFDQSYTVRDGSIFGMIGPSGCGKTTTVRLALGLLRPQSGTIRVLKKIRRRSGPTTASRSAISRSSSCSIPTLRSPKMPSSLPRCTACRGRALQAAAVRAAALCRHGRRPQPAGQAAFGRHAAPPDAGRRADARPRAACSPTSRPRASIRCCAVASGSSFATCATKGVRWW